MAFLGEARETKLNKKEFIKGGKASVNAKPLGRYKYGMGGRKQYLGGIEVLFVCSWSDDSLIISASNWIVNLHYTACVLSLLHCMVG